MTSINPDELTMVEREEHEAWLRLAEAREHQLMSEGEAPTADHAMMERLAEDWKRAHARLHSARAAHRQAH